MSSLSVSAFSENQRERTCACSSWAIFRCSLGE